MSSTHNVKNNIRLTPSIIAKYCQVSKSTVLDWIKNGKLEAFTLPSGHYRINKEDFRAFLEEWHMPINGWLFESESEKKGGTE